MKNKSLVFLCILLVLLSFSSCSHENTGIVKIPESSDGAESSVHPQTPNRNWSGKVSDLAQDQFIRDGSCEYEGWKIVVDKYGAHKELSGENAVLENDFVKRAVLGRWGAKKDEGLSYVILTLKIQNLEPDKSRTLYFDQLRLIDASDTDAYLDMKSVAVSSFFPTQRPPEHNLYYCFDVAPGEIVSEKLLFVVPDSFLESEKLLFCFCPGGTSFSPFSERDVNFPYFLLTKGEA